MKQSIILFETIENAVQPLTWELISFAQAISGEERNILCIIPGADIHSLAEEISESHGIEVIAVEDRRLLYPNPDLLADIAGEIIGEYDEGIICMHHTMRSCQIAARISESAGSSCISGVETVQFENNRIRFTRSIFNGKIITSVAPLKDSAVVTVMPGAFPIPEARKKRKAGAVKRYQPTGHESLFKPIGLTESAKDTVGLESADVIIAAGRGIGSEENLSLIRDTAKIFPNAAIGASRILCDLKWLSYAHQVGSTGKTVSPKLYMACGISGAHQHIIGMKNSQIIVAVNTDPNAAINSVAHYVITEDLMIFLPLMVEKYNKKFSPSSEG